MHQPMPKVVVKILRQIDTFMKDKGLKLYDLFRRKDINLSLATTGDQLLSAPELVRVVRQVAPDVDEQDVRLVVAYLDTNENGQLDYHELERAMRRARRDTVKLDGMSKIAEQILMNPTMRTELLRMRTVDAMRTSGYKPRGPSVEEEMQLQRGLPMANTLAQGNGGTHKQRR